MFVPYLFFFFLGLKEAMEDGASFKPRKKKLNFFAFFVLASTVLLRVSEVQEANTNG